MSAHCSRFLGGLREMSPRLIDVSAELKILMDEDGTLRIRPINGNGMHACACCPCPLDIVILPPDQDPTMKDVYSAALILAESIDTTHQKHPDNAKLVPPQRA